MIDEEYVRSKWAEITVKTYGNSRPFWICSQFEYLANGPFETEAEMWQAARAFTEAREEEIRLLEEECDLLFQKHEAASNKPAHQAIYARIMSREQAALTELKRGMRQ
jgi:hypothetical protein